MALIWEYPSILPLPQPLTKTQRLTLRPNLESKANLLVTATRDCKETATKAAYCEQKLACAHFNSKAKPFFSKEDNFSMKGN